MVLLVLGDRRVSKNNVGGKAYYLIKMDCLGIKISPGFVITNKMLKEALNYAEYGGKQADPSAISRSVYDLYRDKISAALKTFSKHDKLIVRSSFATEDSATDSYAGMFLTSPKVRRGEIYDAIGKVFASAYSDRVNAYEENIQRKFIGSTIVQKFIHTDFAGTLFTRHPLNGEKKIVIEYVKGPAENVLSGNANPRKVLLPYDLIEGKNTGSVTIEGLSQNLINILLIYAKEIENKVVNGPADIEWGIKGEDVYVFQARPITGLRRTNIKIKSVKFNSYIQGISASSGVARGRARYLREGIKVSKKNILITKHLHPEDTKYILNSAGVIAEVGGITSHAAVIARERGIPCVTGVRNAGALIKEGETIIIDGGLGRVYINSKRETSYIPPAEEIEDLIPEVTPVSCEHSKVKRINLNAFFAEPEKYALLKKGKYSLVLYVPTQSQIAKYKKVLKTHEHISIFVTKDDFSYLAWMLFMISKHGGRKFLNKVKNSAKSVSSLKRFIESLDKEIYRHLNIASTLVKGNKRDLLKAFEEMQKYYLLNEIKYSIIPKGYAQKYLRETFDKLGFSKAISLRDFLEQEDRNGFVKNVTLNKVERSKLTSMLKVYAYLKRIIDARKGEPKANRTWNIIVRKLKKESIGIEKLQEERYGIVNAGTLNVTRLRHKD